MTHIRIFKYSSHSETKRKMPWIWAQKSWKFICLRILGSESAKRLLVDCWSPNAEEVIFDLPKCWLYFTLTRQACEIGLVSEVLPPERLLERAQVRTPLIVCAIRMDSLFNCNLFHVYFYFFFIKNIKQELGEQWIREERPRILRGGSTVEVNCCLEL